MASLGPEGAPAAQGPKEWATYAMKAIALPIAVIAIGFLLAIMIFSCLCFGLECECSMLPRTPWLLLIWGVLTFSAVGFGMVKRQVASGRTLMIAEKTFTRLETDAKMAGQLAGSLNNTCNEVEALLESIPSTCQYLVQSTMENIVDKIENKTSGMCKTVRKVSSLLEVLDVGLDAVRVYGTSISLHFYWMPLVPLLMILGGCVVLVVSTMLTWFNPHTHVADVADFLLDKIGSWGFALCIIVVAALTAVYLELSIVSGSFCSNVDANVVGIVRHVDFSQFRKDHKTTLLSRDVQQMAEGAAIYYVYGTGGNPMEQMLSDIKDEVMSLDRIWNKTHSYLVPPAGVVCKGIDNIDVTAYVQEALTTIDELGVFVKPEVVWPYYKDVLQEAMCGSIIQGMGNMIIFNVLVGFFMMPILALIADIDLRKWMSHKEVEYNKMTGMYEEGDSSHPLDPHSEDDDGHPAASGWGFHPGHPAAQGYSGYPNPGSPGSPGTYGHYG